MTWTKFGVEFFDECADAGLSDAAVRTHAEALGYLYRTESRDMRIRKHTIRRFAGSGEYVAAVRELVDKRFWREDGAEYVLVHHGNVYRQSLAAQRDKRDRDKRAQQAHRDRERAEREAAKDSGKAQSVSDDVSAYVNATQTDRHTDAYREGSSREGSDGFVSEE